jgi:hypothetical protein
LLTAVRKVSKKGKPTKSEMQPDVDLLKVIDERLKASGKAG